MGDVGDLDLGDLRATDDRLHALVDRNRQIHDRDCINLNPATNTMNPRAEAVLAARQTIVKGAVLMVEQALVQLSERDVVKLDDERRVAVLGAADLRAVARVSRPGGIHVLGPASLRRLP